MTEHNPEPWEFDGRCIRDADGQPVADWCVGDETYEELGGYISPENRNRIIACVNACRGLPTDLLEHIQPQETQKIYNPRSGCSVVVLAGKS